MLFGPRPSWLASAILLVLLSSVMDSRHAVVSATRSTHAAPPIAQRAPTAGGSLDALYARIDAVRREHGVSGAQVALIRPDQTVLWNFGLADPETGAPVADTTMFRAGSVSKSFAGIAMLMLVERKLVSLDDRLSDLAPELPIRNPWHATHPVRLAHLLEASAGFGNEGSTEDIPGDHADIELKRVIENLPIRLDVQWRPGEYTVYHNLGPSITAYLLEKIAKERYEDFVQKNIFDPLGMKQSSFFRTETVASTLALPPRTAPARTGEDPRAYRHIPIRPSGSLNSSAGELSAFVRMLLGRGTFEGQTLLRPESVERFETPTSTLAARKLSTRLGHAINNWTTHYRGVRYHGHGGQLVGTYLAYYGYAPEHGTGFVYMGTSGTLGVAPVFAVMEQILAYFHSSVEPARTVATSPEERKALAGCYVLANPSSLRQPLERYQVEVGGDLLVLARQGAGPRRILGSEQRRILDRTTQAGIFRLRGGRPGRTEITDVAFVKNDLGQQVMQLLNAPHEAFERRECR